MKKTRWSNEKSEISLSCEAPAGLNQSQLHSYLLQVRLEEINKKLTFGDLRPSYYQRTISETLKKQLEDERARVIEEALTTNPELMNPVDYTAHIKDNRDKTAIDPTSLMTPSALAVLNEGGIKKIGTKWAEKIWIPQREFPDVNFIGLIIGPRGNTLKKMENESGAKISIRGKGSLKEGKNDPASLAAAEEELHAFINADSQDKVAKASRLINQIIETASSTPEAANELKRLQLRELAALNGTLREEDEIICANCGQSGHRRFECLERRSVTATTICKICGGGGHLASDCAYKNDPEMMQASRQRAEQMDSEYQAFMSEIGGSNKSTVNNSTSNTNATADNINTASIAEQVMDPVQLQQYYAAMMQQWDPATFAQNWAIPPPAPPQ
jgi:splicing factor 1